MNASAKRFCSAYVILAGLSIAGGSIVAVPAGEPEWRQLAGLALAVFACGFAFLAGLFLGISEHYVKDDPQP